MLQYLADHLDQLAVSTLERRVAALSVAHRLQGAPDQMNPCRHPQVRALLSSAKRAASKAGKMPRRKKAATTDVLEAMIATCRGDSPIDKRDKALLMVGFASGGRRRSELASFAMADLEEAPDGYILHLRRSKTDQRGEGHPLPVRGRAAKALKDWIATARIIEGPLFRSINRHGQIGASLTGRAVADVVKKRAALAGFDPADFGGHSIRQGFVTEAGRRGIHPMAAKSLSGHKSDRIFNGYYDTGDVMNNPAGNLLGMAGQTPPSLARLDS